MSLSNMLPDVRAFRRDLAKCEGVGCDIRQLCRRFTRPAVDGQRWITQCVRFRWVEDFTCIDHQPIPVQPHGGAREEVDGS